MESGEVDRVLFLGSVVHTERNISAQGSPSTEKEHESTKEWCFRYFI